MEAGDDSGGEVEDRQVRCHGLDAGTGSQTLALGADWVNYRATTDLPSNVSGVDYTISDWSEGGIANV